MNADIERQQENVRKLLELIKDNPTLRIVPMVYTECVHDDGFSWWLNSWGDASIEEMYINDERAYIRSSDEEDLSEKYHDDNECSWEEADKHVSELPWELVIAVHIQP